jgi:dolichyl-phosphate-mannose--protein O-mannosyl transferase
LDNVVQGCELIANSSHLSKGKESWEWGRKEDEANTMKSKKKTQALIKTNVLFDQTLPGHRKVWL